MELFEKTLETKEIFDGRVIHVTVDKIELENGNQSTREVVGHPGGVCIAPLDENNCLYFVRQFRYPYKEVVLELPAGKLEKGSNPLENGKRELKEEVGAIGKGYVSLGQLYPSPGYCAEIIHLYFCRIDSVGDTCPDEDEFLKIEKIHIDKAVEMVLNNQIPDSKTQVAVLKTAMLLEKGVF
ncbi:MAG TPA: NUDIX hydrolase [Clostridiales bacterium]|nr:NUDIX hydrolase [Clostridiales bacterium]